LSLPLYPQFTCVIINMKLSQILDAVPNYQHFMTVKELQKSSEAISGKHQDCEWIPLGKSREGRMIYCLKMGKGAKNALFVAYPHPNEPMGAMTIEFISYFLAENPDFLKNSGYSWYFIKAIDIDGAVLNEGWYSEAYDPALRAKNYYRPPFEEQIEWSYPIEYKKLKFTNSPPETRILMKIMDNIKPDFYFSLHNAGFCGVYYYMSHPEPEVYNDYTALVKQEGLPIHLGDPEMAFVNTVAPGIYDVMYVKEAYDSYAKKGLNIAKFYKAGGGSSDYLRELTDGNGFGLVCEIPYIYHDKIMDFSLTAQRKRKLLRQRRKYTSKINRKVKEIFVEIEPYCEKTSRLYTAVADITKSGGWLFLIDDFASWLGIKIGQKATVAEKFHADVASPFETLNHTSMIGRLCGEAAQLNPEKRDRFLELQQEWESMVSLEFERVLKGVDYKVIPIRKIVRVQAGSALIAMNYLLEGNLLE